MFEKTLSVALNMRSPQTPKSAAFYQGDKRIGAIKDVRFTRRFVDIWLGENPPEPELRRKLLGFA